MVCVVGVMVVVGAFLVGILALGNAWNEHKCWRHLLTRPEVSVPYELWTKRHTEGCVPCWAGPLSWKGVSPEQPEYVLEVNKERSDE